MLLKITTVKKRYFGFGVEALGVGEAVLTCPIPCLMFGYLDVQGQPGTGQYSQARTGGRAMWVTDYKHTVMLYCDAIHMYVNPSVRI